MLYIQIKYVTTKPLEIPMSMITMHTGYIEAIMQGKCGRNTETTFDIKWVIGTYGNWKNLNPGGRFGATS